MSADDRSTTTDARTTRHAAACTTDTPTAAHDDSGDDDEIDEEASEAEAGMLRAVLVARGAVAASLQPRSLELLRVALKRPSISFFRPKLLKGKLNRDEVERHGARGAVQRFVPLLAANAAAGVVLFKTHHWLAATLEERLGAAGAHDTIGNAALAGAAGGAAHALVIAPLQTALQRPTAPPLRAALAMALVRDTLGFSGFFAGWNGAHAALRDSCADSRPLELCAAVVAGGVAGGAYQFMAHPFEGKASLGEVRKGLTPFGGRLASTARAAARASRPAVLLGAGTFIVVEVLRSGLDLFIAPDDDGGGSGGAAVA